MSDKQAGQGDSSGLGPIYNTTRLARGVRPRREFLTPGWPGPAHAQRREPVPIWLLRTPRALFSEPLLPTSLEPEGARRMLLAAPAALALCCSAARRAAASAGDSRADSGPRGMLLLRVGERCWVLGRAVRLPLAARCCAREVGEGEGPGMRLLPPCRRGAGKEETRSVGLAARAHLAGSVSRGSGHGSGGRKAKRGRSYLRQPAYCRSDGA